MSLAGPLSRLLQMERSNDLIIYLSIIFILAVLNNLYREIRDLNSKLTRIMQFIQLRYLKIIKFQMMGKLN